MHTLTLSYRGPFSLAASVRCLDGFTPAALGGGADESLELAFPAEGTWQTVGVRVRQEGDAVVAELASPNTPGPELLAAVRTQLERLLSLDVDGSEFPAVDERDEVVARLRLRYPGLRPVGFCSPYEAAAWAIISHRLPIGQAVAAKAHLARQFGEAVSLDGRVLRAFPAPYRLAELVVPEAPSGGQAHAGTAPSLSGRKPEWLRSLARATLDGRLDAARLRALSWERALADLMRLPGIGRFSAELVLLRGVGVPDHVPTNEPRLRRAVALAYGLDTPPSPDQLCALSERWRPYRTWVTVLLRRYLEDETREVGGQSWMPRPR